MSAKRCHDTTTHLKLRMNIPIKYAHVYSVLIPLWLYHQSQVIGIMTSPIFFRVASLSLSQRTIKTVSPEGTFSATVHVPSGADDMQLI